MKTDNILFFWVHGVQAKALDPEAIRRCMNLVYEKLLPVKSAHRLFNWDDLVGDRQELLYSRVQGRGHWLTRKIRKAICSIGTDMWWNLETKRGDKPNDLYAECQNRLTQEIEEASKQLDRPYKLALVCHSWGCWVGLRWLINHPEVKARLVTMGSPLLYGSGAYRDWGNPDLLPNIERWVNIGTPNDPISTLMKDNPNEKWAGFVQDIDLPSGWNFLPLSQAHSLYWKSPVVIDKIVETALWEAPSPTPPV